ncbi:hypothetical protein [Desulfitobacterium sp.]|uniref:hypothetical protein n=1 Tax=Desulfitobacterium sp. TaxID=49981 RepID=UPI002B1F6B16|nr:hypothetical protein [Desulfitobacterium sp.]MEA4901659.1 hypothetical protein [Desulfitobacterium sp.]
MKEKIIELSSEEIRYLLGGTIHWQDIQEKEKQTVRSSAVKSEMSHSPETQVSERQVSECQVSERSELNRILLGNNQSISPHCLEGKPVVFVLATVGLLTVSAWIYFVFAG